MDKTLKVGQQSLLGYLPAIVIKKILDGEIDHSKKLPAAYLMNTVSLFADISGFTKLSEAFSKKGRIGPEFLAFSLNRYMEQIINIIGKNGGDIFKFAGDALLVVWPETKSGDLTESCRRAIQCAMDIQSKLNMVEIPTGQTLSVKIGIGVGECRILLVGGQFKRCEYLIIGEAMRQACESETHALGGGETICSEDVFRYVKNYYAFEEAHGDGSHGPGDGLKYFKIIKLIGDRVPTKSDAYLMRTHFNSDKLREKQGVLRVFVPAAITIYLDIEKETWSKEIRMLTIMFLNLKVDLSQTKDEKGIARIQDIVRTVQRCVYRTKGSLNKFLMDDKGSVMLIVWGLPPLSAADDHVRAVVTALDLQKELQKYNCGAYMGITTGSCFTGVCGTVGGRREYSLLGEIVNLSARYMGKAIYHSKDLQKEKKKQTDYLILIDEKTRDLIQNKIPSDYITQDNLKGFVQKFYFYEPKFDVHSKPNSESIAFFLPDIKTHKNNVLIGYPNPDEKNNTPENMLKKALFMVGRKDYLEECIGFLNKVYKNGECDLILIRGITGSGKSLFIRKALWDFIERNKELKPRVTCNNYFANNNSSLIGGNDFSNYKVPFIFVGYQTPLTYNEPMNGWTKILKEVYEIIKIAFGSEKKKISFKIAMDTVEIECDPIGEILMNSDCYSYVRYIEEILDANFSNHCIVPQTGIFSKFFKIKEFFEQRDNFFDPRKFDKHEKNICRFFHLMIKVYKETFFGFNDTPLIFVIEDAQFIDEISIEFMRLLTKGTETGTGLVKPIKGIAIISSYQENLNGIVRNPFDKFYKYSDMLFTEHTFMLENISDFSEMHEIVKFNIQHKANVNTINENLINLVLTKSFKGNPLFTIEMFNSLIDNRFVRQANNELLPSSGLMEMYENNDWIKFTVPTLMEKVIGNIIDNLSPKEIVILKHAAVIGNIFDIDKLNKMNPFNSVTFDDLSRILHNLESFGIIEILYDLKPKKLVCKFNVPFIREILYQRMLIEQRNDIHLNVARMLQYNKLSYFPHKKEVFMLENHLQLAEKTILWHMEDEVEKGKAQKNDNTSIASNTGIKYAKSDNHKLTPSNLKIIIVKEICEKLKIIDLRLESEDIDISRRSIPQIKSGILSKKSDKNITWEDRYIVITNSKFFYWYFEADYQDNKMPLGSFDLKNLYNVTILRDKEIGSKLNVFEIQVSAWFKKDVLKNARKYYFSCDTRDELYYWVVTLNFLRVKAIYDEFTFNFGLIKLPLMHEIKGKTKKQMKRKFHHMKKAVHASKQHHNMYNSMARKSVVRSYEPKNSAQNDSGPILTRENSLLRSMSVMPNQAEITSDDLDSQERIVNIKELLSVNMNKTFIVLIGFMQDIIFNVDSVGLSSEERMIPIPQHLNKFKSWVAPEYKSTVKPSMITTNNLVREVSTLLNQNLEQGNNANASSSGQGNTSNHNSSNNVKKNLTNINELIEEREDESGSDVEILSLKAKIGENNNISKNSVKNKNEFNDEPSENLISNVQNYVTHGTGKTGKTAKDNSNIIPNSESNNKNNFKQGSNNKNEQEIYLKAKNLNNKQSPLKEELNNNPSSSPINPNLSKSKVNSNTNSPGRISIPNYKENPLANKLKNLDISNDDLDELMNNLAQDQQPTSNNTKIYSDNNNSLYPGGEEKNNSANRKKLDGNPYDYLDEENNNDIRGKNFNSSIFKK